MVKNKKKWIIITVISLVLIAAEVLFSIFYLIPLMKGNKVIEKVKAGDSVGAEEIMDTLSKSDRAKVKDKVRDVVVSETNNYITNNGDYDKLKKLLLTVENVSWFYNMADDCFTEANPKELKRIYDELVTELSGSSSDSRKSDALLSSLHDVYFITGEEKIDGVDTISNYLEYFDPTALQNYQAYIKEYFNDILQKDYDNYLAGNGNIDRIVIEADIVSRYFYKSKSGSDLAVDIKAELETAQTLQAYIDKMEEFSDNKEYVEAVNQYIECTTKYADKILAENVKTVKNKLDDAYKRAIEEGTIYYNSKFEEFKEKKDKDSAKKLYEEVKDHFALNDDVLSGFNPEWAESYIAFMNNYEKHLKDALDKGNPIKDYIPTDAGLFDLDAPKSYSLYDLDKNGTPELIINGEYYSHIFAYKSGKVEYIATTGKLITTKDDTICARVYINQELGDYMAAEKYLLFKFDGKKIEISKYTSGEVFKDGTVKYIVDGKETTDSNEFIKAAQDIVANAVNYVPETGKIGDNYEKEISDYTE